MFQIVVLRHKTIKYTIKTEILQLKFNNRISDQAIKLIT